MNIARNESAFRQEARRDAEQRDRSCPPPPGRGCARQWTTTEFSATAFRTRSAPDDLDHERLPRRVVERQHRAADQHQREHHPRLDQRRVSVSANSVSAGTAIDSCVIVSSVRFDIRSASRPPQAPNSRIGRNCSPAVSPTDDAGAGQLHHQPHLADDLHPVAGDRDHLAGEVPAVVGNPERGERPRAITRRPPRASARGFRRRDRARRGPRGSGGPVAEPDTRPCDRGRRRAARGPAGVIETRLERRSSGSARALDEAGLLQPSQHARGGGPLDPLAGRELGRRQRPVAVDRRQRGALGGAQLRTAWRMRRASRVTTGRSRWARSVVEIVRTAN